MQSDPASAMRGRLPNPRSLTNVTRHTLISSSSFSTSSGRGGGRGRGLGGASPFDFASGVPEKPEPTADPNSESSESPFPLGLGHGRGKPPSQPSAPTLPSFSSFASTGIGRGRGRLTAHPTDSVPQQSPDFAPKKPIFFSKEDAADSAPKPQSQLGTTPPEENNLPVSILSALSGGAGRGQPLKQTPAPPKEENRHLRQPRQPVFRSPQQPVAGPPQPRLSREEAVKKAVGILSRGGDGGGDGDGDEGGRGRGFRGRGRGRGRGAQGWMGRGRGRGRGRMGDRRGRGGDAQDDYGAGLYLGDNADAEKLSNKIGLENMSKLDEAFEEMSGRVLPSPIEDAYLDALHTNCSIEFEPEYLMEEFGTNPDIDENPPIPLRDALEKMKPFLMQYEGIQSQEEWEEVMKETMENVPYLKELVDYYSGPDRVTAKKQQEELERVAKTLPETAPNSVKRFTDRAILSLQSNPGWGFDKKCQFMDKLVWEVSQHYK